MFSVLIFLIRYATNLFSASEATEESYRKKHM